jgi:hypothetical protein
MIDEVITLKHETDAVVPVAVPIGILEIFGGFAVDNEITAGVLVETPDDVQKRCFSSA